MQPRLKRVLQLVLGILLLGLAIEVIILAREFALRHDGLLHVRLANRSPVDFREVTVGTNHMGDLGRGTLTDYQTVSAAYHDPYVSVRLGGRQIQVMTPDYQSQQPFGKGWFTYVLSLEGDHLFFHVERDR